MISHTIYVETLHSSNTRTHANTKALTCTQTDLGFVSKFYDWMPYISLSHRVLKYIVRKRWMYIPLKRFFYICTMYCTLSLHSVRSCRVWPTMADYGWLWPYQLQWANSGNKHNTLAVFFFNSFGNSGKPDSTTIRNYYGVLSPHHSHLTKPWK